MTTYKKRKEKKKKSRKLKGGSFIERSKDYMKKIIRKMTGTNSLDPIKMSKADDLMKEIDKLLKSEDWVEIWTSEKWRNTLQSKAYRVRTGRSYKDALVERNDFYGKKLKEMQTKFNNTQGKIKTKLDELIKIVPVATQNIEGEQGQNIEGEQKQNIEGEQKQIIEGEQGQNIEGEQKQNIDLDAKTKELIQTRFINSLSILEELSGLYKQNIIDAIDKNEKFCIKLDNFDKDSKEFKNASEEFKKAVNLDAVVKEFKKIIEEFKNYHKKLNEKINQLKKIEFTSFEELKKIKTEADNNNNKKKETQLKKYISIRRRNKELEVKRNDLIKEIEGLRKQLNGKDLNDIFEKLIFLIENENTHVKLKKLVGTLKIKKETNFNLFNEVVEETNPKNSNPTNSNPAVNSPINGEGDGNINGNREGDGDGDGDGDGNKGGKQDSLEDDITEDTKQEFYRRSNMADNYSEKISHLISYLNDNFINNIQSILNNEEKKYKTDKVFEHLEEKNNELIKDIQIKLQNLSKIERTNLDILNARYSDNPQTALKEIEKNINNIVLIQNTNPDFKSETIDNLNKILEDTKKELEDTKKEITNLKEQLKQNPTISVPEEISVESKLSQGVNDTKKSKTLTTTNKKKLNEEINKLKSDKLKSDINESNKKNIEKFLSIVENLGGKSPTKEQLKELNDIIIQMENSGGGIIRGGDPKEIMKKILQLLQESVVNPEDINKKYNDIINLLNSKYSDIDQEKVKIAIDAALASLKSSSTTNGFLDAFYKSFNSDSSDSNSKLKKELDSAIDNNVFQIYYFPSESKHFGEPGKVIKNNEYGDYGIIRTNPNTSFGTSLKKNIRKSEDFIAQLLQGRTGDPRRKPIFKKKIEIQDRSQIIEIAKRHMNEKRKDIDNIFQKLYKPEPKKTGGKKKYTKKYTKKHKKTRKHKGGSKESKEFLKEIYDDFASIADKEKIKEKYNKITDSNYDNLRKLYKFRTDIENNLKQNNYDMVLENNSNSLYQYDETIQKLDREIV